MTINYTLPEEFKKMEYLADLPGYIEELESKYTVEFAGKLEKLDVDIKMEINRPVVIKKEQPETFNEDGTEGKVIIPFRRNTLPSKKLSAIDTPTEFYKVLRFVLEERIINEYKKKFPDITKEAVEPSDD